MDRDLELWVPSVYRFAYRLAGNAHLAEELTQEAMLRAWRQRGNLREPAATRVWLFRVTANLWRDRLRRGKLAVSQAGELPLEVTGREPSPGQVAAVRDELDRVRSAMLLLPPRQREVLHLSAYESMPHADIAVVLGISPEAVKSNLALARKTLRKLLDESV